jgi:hypothetical protein
VTGPTQVSGCAGCRQLICRGADGDPWHVMPEPGEVLYPQVAEFCMFFPDGLHHPPIRRPE